MNDFAGFATTARRAIRLVRQTEVAECGLACLAMVADHHGLAIDLGTLRRRFEPSLRGAPLKSLIAMADGLGLTARAVRLPLSDLPDLQVPAILHWDLNHYVVLGGVQRGKASIHDPARGSLLMPLREVSNHFTGIALELRPADDFEVADRRARLRISQLWQRITGLKRAIAQVAILSLVLQAFVLASPYYMQIALDSALPALDRDLMTVLALGFALFTVINAGAALLRSMVLIGVGTALSYGITVNVARRLFRLPVAWFERRHVGDVLSRFQSIAPVRDVMTEGAVGAVLDGAMTLFTLAIMLFYSLPLTVIALAAFAAYGLVRAISFPLQKEAQSDAITFSGREQTTLVETLRGMVTLRLYNREASRLALWQTRLTDSVNAGVRLARLHAWQDAANILIFGLEVIASAWLAILSVMNGGFTVGMVFAFMAYKTQFLARGASLVDQGVTMKMLGLHLERLSDIALAEQDESFSAPHGVHRDLEGRIELRDVEFRYSPSEPLVLDRVDLIVQPGEHVAITGASGGGKSTLIRILLGLLSPQAGDMLVDGQPLSRFGHRHYRDQIGAILQDDSLFAGSLADNIALFDDLPDPERIREAAVMAALDDEIAAMPMGYDTLVGDMGSSLSGGQRQRLLLARALYRRPRLLVMDEGTSHLDPHRERLVNEAVATLGITRIIVAHRLETVLSAERIYTLEKGSLTDTTAEFAARRALHSPATNFGMPTSSSAAR